MYSFIHTINHTLTMKVNDYTFINDNMGYRKHFGHSMEYSEFSGSWYCHTCNEFWDEQAATEYDNALHAEKRATELGALFTSDTCEIRDNWGDY